MIIYGEKLPILKKLDNDRVEQDIISQVFKSEEIS
jgi:hypothetical protein